MMKYMMCYVYAAMLITVCFLAVWIGQTTGLLMGLFCHILGIIIYLEYRMNRYWEEEWEGDGLDNVKKCGLMGEKE